MDKNKLPNIKDIIKEIKDYNNFHQVEIKKFAVSDGWAAIIAKENKNMKTTQLRKVFNTIKLIEQRIKNKEKNDKFDDPELYMLLPHLAYAKGRKFITQEFYELIKTIIPEKIKTVNDFKRFCEFMTAIVAYHKSVSK